MSFQSFRLGEMAMQQPLPPHLLQLQAGSSSQQFPGTADNTNNSAKIGQRAPYGSGDSDDGYTLVFPNLAAFFEWKEKEEDTQVVEFVKGDTHGSKAVPPRFKEHTKLVCARHSRSGRKKYVKKHPERVRKVPSRKIEGGGCPASISYKTYFDTEEVRACYISQHSHEIGLANLPFTRKGRKQAAEHKTGRRRTQTEEPTPTPGPSASSQTQPTTSFSVPMISQQQQQHPPAAVHYPPPQSQPFGYQPPYPAPPPQAPGASFGQDRWQNMETLFHSIRDQARTFAYPVASVAALESVLIRLFLESPSQQPVAVVHHHQTPGPPQPQPQPPPQQHQHIPGGEDEDESGSDESS